MDDLYNYLKLNSHDILDTVIYIRYKNNIGKQIHIYYNKCSYSNNNDIMEIIHFNDFIKQKNERFFISTFGLDYDITFFTLKKYIRDLIGIGRKEILIINLCKKNDKPDEKNNYELLIDRTFMDESTKDECPVCKLSWKDCSKTKLRCSHSICIDCLITLIKTEKYNCPVCRLNITTST